MIATSMPSKYAAAQRFISFVNASPTPFHAVKSAVARLEKSGFTRLLETESDWDSALKGGGRFYITRYSNLLLPTSQG
jgi:aspartyl aminopeptidase